MARSEKRQRKVQQSEKEHLDDNFESGGVMRHLKRNQKKKDEREEEEKQVRERQSRRG